MKPYKLQRLTALLAILVPIFMVLPVGHFGVFISWGSLLFLLGAAGVLQTFFANQNLPFVCLRDLQEPEEKTDFHHICATASVFAGCIPGIVLGYSLYSRVNEPSSLGPILAIIILTFAYGLMIYLMHFVFMALQPGAHTNPTREASWLQEHHYQVRRVFLFTIGVVACSTLIILISFMSSGQEYGMENFHYDQLVDRTLSTAQEWLLILFHYSKLPWWVLLISLFYKLIFWSRGYLGFASDNNPWILSNLTLVFGAIGTIAIFIYMLVNLETPYGFILPIAPILVLTLSWGLSMWMRRPVRNQNLPRYQVETEFISPPLWTRIFQIACFAIIAVALSIGGFEALAESFLSIGLLCLFGIYSLSRQRKLETMVDRRTLDLQLANKRNEALLHNVLPVSIAERLKRDQEGIIADDHHQVSILFADIAGFTAMSSEMSSGELVKLLSLVFARFDTLAEKHRVEKIKTIGDAYMAAVGVPTERSDHAHALAAFALDIQRELKTISQELGRQLDIRIGLHSGPVTAGVIGTQKFAYDLWGDTVNTASRMESNGKVGAIQISEETKALIEDAFAVEQRGKVTMKGKGDLMTYLLLGTREQS